jgi:hypothetical protein
MYASDRPYLEKWREAMRYLDDDRESGYQKIWFELQAMAWNRPEMRARLAPVLGEWKAAMRDAVSVALEEYGVAEGHLTAEDWVSLIVTFNEGIILERLSGITGAGSMRRAPRGDRSLASRARGGALSGCARGSPIA